MYKLKYSPLWLNTFLVVAACNSNPKGIATGLDQTDSTGSESTDTLSKNNIKLSNCYLATIGRDSAFLQIQSSGNEIQGMLHYQPQDRPEEQGEISGTISHDTIWVNLKNADQPNREITFLVRGEQLVEGLGQQILEKGQVVYKDKVKIDYTGHSYVFLPAECEQSNRKTERKEDSHL